MPSEFGKVCDKEFSRFHSPLPQRAAVVSTMVFDCHSPESCTFLVGSDR